MNLWTFHVLEVRNTLEKRCLRLSLDPGTLGSTLTFGGRRTHCSGSTAPPPTLGPASCRAEGLRCHWRSSPPSCGEYQLNSRFVKLDDLGLYYWHWKHFPLVPKVCIWSPYVCTWSQQHKVGQKPAQVLCAWESIGKCI